MVLLADMADVSGEWLKNALVFICAAAALYAIFMRRSTLPQPLETREATQWASAEGVRKLAGDVENLRRELAGQRDKLHTELNALEARLSEAGERRAADIHDRINPIAREIHTLSGSVTEISRTLHELANHITAAAKAKH